MIKAIIVDIDGTIALKGNRNPFNWFKVYSDSVNEPVLNLVKIYQSQGYQVIFLSGRDGICRDLTEKWLNEKCNLKNYLLYMRPIDDRRKDSIVKRELFDEYINNIYDIEIVLDDRDQVVEMWRNDLKLTCFQVAYGNF